MGAGNRKNDSSNGKDDGYATIPPDSIHSTITAEISNPTSNESSKKPITVPTINKQDEIKIAGWNGKEERKIKRNDLKIGSWNIRRGLISKENELKEILKEEKFDIILNVLF